MNFCCFLVTNLCLTVCDPMDYSPAGSSLHGAPHPRILEWVATSFSKAPSEGSEPALAGGLSFLWGFKSGFFFEMDSKKLMCTNIILCWEMRLPWWFTGWESDCQCRGYRFDPWSGKIPRVIGQQAKGHNYWACVLHLLKSAHPRAWALQQRESMAMKNLCMTTERNPTRSTRESPRAATKTQHSQKYFFFK